jgi:hypothetical protein
MGGINKQQLLIIGGKNLMGIFKFLLVNNFFLHRRIKLISKSPSCNRYHQYPGVWQNVPIPPFLVQ